jgi:hypothetical protein
MIVYRHKKKDKQKERRKRMTYLIGKYAPPTTGYRGAIPATVVFRLKENSWRHEVPFI